MKSNTYDVCIVGGLGHAGLPLGILLAEEGKKVILYDIDLEAADIVSKGRMPFLEIGAQDILNKVINRTLFVSSDRKVISESYFVIIVIGTPVDEHLNPRLAIFKDFLRGIIDVIKDEHHIILRSTVYPGTTEKIRDYLKSQGKHPRVSFCPERISQGNSLEELRSLPQIVSSFDEAATQEAEELFSVFTKDIICLRPIEAELAKLFTNVWRYIQFAISNQFYQIATEWDADFYEIYNATIHKYPRTQSFPPAGFAAGPCLFKDTMQLAACTNNSFFLGHAAMLINEGLPNFLVQRLKNKYSLKDKVVGILGMAFKADNDDKRESLSYKLKKLLEIEAKRILCSDVYIQEDDFVSPEFLVENSDIIILATPHREYRRLSIKGQKVLVDVWNFYGNGGLF